MFFQNIRVISELIVMIRMRCRMRGGGSWLLQPAPSCFGDIRGAQFKRPITSEPGAVLSQFIDTFTRTNCTFLAFTNRPEENWRFVVDFIGANLNAAVVYRNIYFGKFKQSNKFNFMYISSTVVSISGSKFI